jgi:hypothetical protein
LTPQRCGECLADFPHTIAKLKSRSIWVETFWHKAFTVVPFRIAERTTGSAKSGWLPFLLVYILVMLK